MMKIKTALYDQILSVFQYKGAERGGLLLIKKNEIVGFYLDQEEFLHELSYKPGFSIRYAMMEAISKNFDTAFIHCHPQLSSLSEGDLSFARGFLSINGWKQIGMALVAGKSLGYYQVTEDGCREEQVEIVSS